MSLVDDPTEPGSSERWRPPVHHGGIRWGRIGVAGAVVVALVVGAVVLISHALRSAPAPIVAACSVGSGTASQPWTLSPDQAANASTIAAVGHDLGLPDHAVTIALATALQESRLINLPGGDRDSVGLFQQRPSEGWGSPAELIQPVYAATAFYQALEKVSGWQTLAVTVAAQDVQHSAAPDAYAYQETEARAFAVAFTGESPAAFACHADPTPAGAAWRPALAAQLGGLAPATAATSTVPAGAGTAVDATDGWILATWLVAHAQQYGFRSVSFAGRTWEPRWGAWRSGGASDGRVHLA